MEQIRIIKEMREHDKATGGRTGFMVRCRYCIWENVSGAFSSNNGKDFQAVLTEFVRIAEPDAPDVPMPDDGRWPHAGFIYQKLGGWSVAWRTHDAQYWGVPQRRKRICVLADFNGLTAGEILFDPQLWGTAEDGEPLPFDRYSGAERRPEVQTQPESLSGDSTESGETGEGTAAFAGSGSEAAIDGRIVCYGISAFDSNAMKSPNPHSGIYEADTARTLDLNGGSPACNQGGMAIVCYPETANTLPARMDGSPCIDRGPPIVVLASNQNHAPISEDGICPTLPAAMGEGGGYVPMIAQGVVSKGNGQRPSRLSNFVLCLNPWDPQSARVYDANGIWHSLNANENGGQSRDAVFVYENHGQDSRVKELGDICESVSAKYGTGGNNTPIVLSIGNGQLNQIAMSDKANTLDTMHDPQAVLLLHAPDTAHALHAKANCQYREDSETYIVAAVDCRNGVINSEVNGTLQAKEQGQNLNSNNVVLIYPEVRRLTPLETERLQGFPDNWSKYGLFEDGTVKELSDSARFKIQGNSIARPFWTWLLRRIAAQYERQATLGGLFSGQGGFELCAMDAGIKPLWCSEIEKNAVAVMKYHFPEVDT